MQSFIALGYLEVDEKYQGCNDPVVAAAAVAVVVVA